ncbi:lanthionine synthetase LanC family protein [Streptomyces rubellomurinus]|uniref:lanthionine synthetase LanC family protein n=1 Tax=Streptomyces rubellomurinus (strain ATCC 31215) TaxID=359131 RepID=UPI000698188F|nr:lanthionine synthetase LanC family protein [Streptomyces rubellomurinus]
MTPTETVRAVTAQLARPADPEAVPAPGLGAGPSGAALALAVLAGEDPALRRAAHGLLAGAVRAPGAMRGGGLYSGAAAVAFAARTMAREPGEYRGLLDALVPRVGESAAGRVVALRADLATGAGLRAHTFDAVSGAAGLGRLLLALEPEGPALAGVLAALVELAAPGGGALPRWWTAGGPGLPGADPDHPRGHVNLGLAHGVPGPLALLALARLQGVRVPGQDEAIEGLASWLAAHRRPAGGWPMTVRVEDVAAGRPPADAPTRAAWCYGTPGAARALFLAGTALGRADWRDAAVAALADALADPAAWHLAGAGLCHGTGGLLRIVQRMAEDSGSAALADHLPALAAATARDLAAALAAGEPATLLEGTAGAALALHAHLHGDPRPGGAAGGGWDAFLLLG